jgi:RNA polymerase sigma-70 factor (ECF subfamily)
MTQPTDSQDLALLRRMMAGEEEAFTLLYRLRHPAIYRFALRMSGNAALAEDVTQEVFMTLIRDARRFDPTRGTLGGFLFGVARNHLRKRWEEDRRLVPLENESADTIPFPSKMGTRRAMMPPVDSFPPKLPSGSARPFPPCRKIIAKW